jgi:hypothetical protein
MKMTISEILQWYGGSFVMHLTMAAVLGVVMWYGMFHNPAANPKKEIK